MRDSIDILINRTKCATSKSHSRAFAKYRHGALACAVLAVSLWSMSALGAGDFVWARQFQGTAIDGHGLGEPLVTSSPTGAVYFVGRLDSSPPSTLDLDPGPGVCLIDTADWDSESGSHMHLYVCKWDSAGAFVWGGAIYAEQLVLGSISSDGEGNLYISGTYTGQADFDPRSSVFGAHSIGANENQFVLKLGPDGQVAWIKSFDGGYLNFNTAIAVDTSGNVYTTGHYADASPSHTPHGAYVRKQSATGELTWEAILGSTNDVLGAAMATDASGNLYLSGSFLGTADFDPGPGTVSLTTAPGKRAAFISKFNDAGSLLWSRQLESDSDGLGTSQAFTMGVDDAGNAYVSGSFSHTVDFDPGASQFKMTSLMDATYQEDIFLLKLDADGAFVWANQLQKFPYPSHHQFGAAVDTKGNTYFTSSFQGPVDIDPGPGTVELGDGIINRLLISKLDSSGNLVWGKQIGSVSGAISPNNRIVLSSSNDIIVTGTIGGTVDVDPGPGNVSMTSTDHADVLFSLRLTNSATVSLSSAAPELTSATSIPVTVTFSVPVTDFTADDISTTNAIVSNFSGAGAEYTFDLVPTSQGTVTAQIGAGVAHDADGDGNEASDVLSRTFDSVPPALTLSPPSSPTTNGAAIVYTVTYTGASAISLSLGDITLGSTGTASANVNISGAGTTMRLITLYNISGAGSLSVSLAAATAIDSAGNQALAVGPSASVEVDTVPPTGVIGAPSLSETKGEPVTYTVTYLEAALVTLSADDIELHRTGTANCAVTVTAGGSGEEFIVTLVNPTGVGALSFSVAGGTATDAYGNTIGPLGPSLPVTVDNGPPTDLDGDGVVSATDIQSVINAALGLPGNGPRADVDNDGTVDAVDVQKVINAALGLV